MLNTPDVSVTHRHLFFPLSCDEDLMVNDAFVNFPRKTVILDWTETFALLETLTAIMRFTDNYPGLVSNTLQGGLFTASWSSGSFTEPLYFIRLLSCYSKCLIFSLRRTPLLGGFHSMHVLQRTVTAYVFRKLTKSVRQKVMTLFILVLLFQPFILNMMILKLRYCLFLFYISVYLC